MTNKKENSQCTGSYEVSGYTTSDGKKVGSYTRTCWKHGSGGGSGSGVQNTQGNIKNDMRHIVGPALFAQLYGSETTRLLSYLKNQGIFYCNEI